MFFYLNSLCFWLKIIGCNTRDRCRWSKEDSWRASWLELPLLKCPIYRRTLKAHESQVYYLICSISFVSSFIYLLASLEHYYCWLIGDNCCWNYSFVCVCVLERELGWVKVRSMNGWKSQRTKLKTLKLHNSSI